MNFRDEYARLNDRDQAMLALELFKVVDGNQAELTPLRLDTLPDDDTHEDRMLQRIEAIAERWSAKPETHRRGVELWAFARVYRANLQADRLANAPRELEGESK